MNHILSFLDKKSFCIHQKTHTFFLKKHQANKVDLVSNSPVILWSDPDDCNRSFLFANHLGLDYG